MATSPWPSQKRSHLHMHCWRMSGDEWKEARPRGILKMCFLLEFDPKLEIETFAHHRKSQKVFSWTSRLGFYSKVWQEAVQLHKYCLINVSRRRRQIPQMWWIFWSTLIEVDFTGNSKGKGDWKMKKMGQCPKVLNSNLLNKMSLKKSLFTAS